VVWKGRPPACEGDIPETKLFQALTTIRLKTAHGIIAGSAEDQRAEWARTLASSSPFVRF
jgi:hypothetical protein